jgi:uncharacterized small protein (DUF1192 family)
MDWDDLKPKKPAGTEIGASLETLSVAELEARIDLLQAEITRVKEEITRKRRIEDAARSVFKT